MTNTTQSVWPYRERPYRKTGIFLAVLGSVLAFLSVFLELTILAVISLGIIFWGVVLALAKMSEVVLTQVLNSSFASTLNVVEKLILNMGFERGMYIPPGHLRDMGEGGVFFTRRGLGVREVRHMVANKKTPNQSGGCCFTPPGIGLANLLERQFESSLNGKGVEFLENTLPKFFTENGISEDVSLEADGDIVFFSVTNPAYGLGCEEIRKHQSCVCTYIGCPFCSALAYMLAKTTGRIVTIERNGLSTDNKIIYLWCRMDREM